VAQILAGRVTVNSLMRIVAATYSVFQGRDDDVNAAFFRKNFKKIVGLVWERVLINIHSFQPAALIF